jgi:hypothetical protein
MIGQLPDLGVEEDVEVKTWAQSPTLGPDSVSLKS